MIAKSPFLIYSGFVSPKMGEQIVDSLGVTAPDVDVKGTPQPLIRQHAESEEMIFDKLQVITTEIEKYYGCNYRGTEHLFFEWFPENSQGQPRSENSDYLRKKWVRTKDRDISAVLFLSDFNDKVPFDSEYEVFGGKLEFPQHGFGFNPVRGTLVIFPSQPHFINATAKINVGNLFQVRIHMATQIPYLYNPKLFPGTYKEWFKEELSGM